MLARFRLACTVQYSIDRLRHSIRFLRPSYTDKIKKQQVMAVLRVSSDVWQILKDNTESTIHPFLLGDNCKPFKDIARVAESEN
jgi:hypothetical protein